MIRPAVRAVLLVLLLGVSYAARGQLTERYYSVQLDDAAAAEAAHETADDIAASHGGVVVGPVRGDTFTVRVAESRARVVSADPRVRTLTEVAPDEANAPVHVATDATNWSAGVAYSYDGSGNIRQIGTDTFTYDAVNRLVEGHTDGVPRTYKYDGFGNRTGCMENEGTPVVGDCQAGVTIVAAQNRIGEATYDTAGNVVGLGSHTYSYDALNMQTRDVSGIGAREYVYTADDERLAVYEVGQRWHWTVRETSGKVLREFTSANGTWEWKQDHVWRGGLLAASLQMIDGVLTTYHYHLDHLGSPRRVTDSQDRIAGVHDYMPFGPEKSGGKHEASGSSMKYTGHERDGGGQGETSETLDYMHARFYAPHLGRFLSVDPGKDWDLHQPQSWNMYTYVRNNPLSRIDPTGKTCADANLIGPCRPTAEVTLAPPRNAANWTPEQRAAENAKNAHRAQLAEEGKLVVTRDQARPSSAQVAAANGGTAPAGAHLDHTQEIVLGGAPLAKANIAPLDATVNTSNGARVKNAIAGLVNGTVITKFSYTTLGVGNVLGALLQARSYATFVANQQKAHPGFVNTGDMARWVFTGDTKATPTPCSQADPC